jgi:hypothetical protein
LDRLGCFRVIVVALAAGEIAVMVALFDLALAEVVPSTPGNALGIAKVIALIAGCLVIPTAAAAHAYLARTGRSVWVALGALVVHPIVLVSLLALR